MNSTLLISATLIACMATVGCGGGGGSVSTQSPAAVSFTSNPPRSGSEGQVYSYVMSATGSGFVTFQVINAPAGAYVSGNTLTWTPTANQARTVNSFSVVVSDGNTSALQQWSVTPSGPVDGTDFINHVTQSGNVQIPVDTTLFPIAAAVPDGIGGYSILLATGSPNGTFTISEVPGGYYWLQTSPTTFVWTSSSSIDIGSDVFGRTDVTYPSSPTQVDLAISGLNPWQSDDHQQVYVVGTDTWLDYEWGVLGLSNGATSLLQPVPWSNPLVDGSKGDQVYITQLVTTPIPGSSAQVLAKSIAAPIFDFVQVDGSEQQMSANLQDVALDHSFRANIAGSAFAQMESSMNPSATTDSSYFYLDVDPGRGQYGWVGGTPDLIMWDGTNSPITSDLDLGDIAYGNPYPSTWEKFLEYTHYVRVDYTAPGATNSAPQYAYLELQTTTLPTIQGPLAPSIGPINTATINSVDFFKNQNNVGDRPTLAWNAPSLGIATGYEVQVYHLYTDGTNSLSEQVGTLYTKTTTIQLPPGVLVPGNSYFFCVAAISEPGVDFEKNPFRLAFPYAAAQTLSGVVTP